MIRVFVSSTWVDVQPERLAVERALHRMRGTEHLGMEYFGSRPETPHDASLEEVDRSDVYVGIFGFRYGSGITEAEYRRARERGLPCFIYLKDGTGPAGDAEPEKIEQLAVLKGELQQAHIVTYFASPDDLASKVATDLHSYLFKSLPPPASAPARRHNLPAAVDRFVGREREIQPVQAMITDHRLVTLTGGGGAGKSRLATEVAQRLIDEAPERFPDGIWLVELATLREPSLLPQTVAVTFGLREAPGSTYLDVLTEHLTSKTLLLLLDNCEHLVAACRALVDRLLRASPGLRVLATSRALLEAPGEVTWRVPSLAVPHPPPPPPTPEQLSAIEAVVLFLERARAKRSAFSVNPTNAAAVAEICRRLDGIPLAIELAAARVRSRSPQQIADHLADRFDLLTGGNALVPRQQTLRAALDWSHDLLAEPERILLRRLGVFVGGWTLEAAEAVCTDDLLPPDDILDLLESLADQSLVSADDDPAGEIRYRLLETVREYALERLGAAREADATRQRHADWALALAEEASPKLTGPDQGAWLDCLTTEHDNLRAAIQWTVDTADAERALRFGGSLWRFWVVRGFVAEGRNWLERTLALPTDGEVRAARTLALHAAGNLAYFQAELEAARAHYEESLAIRRVLGDRGGVAASLVNLGNVARVQGDSPAAQARYEECLAIYRELGDQVGIAMSLTNLGDLAHGRGEYPAARAWYEESLAINRKAGNREGIATALCELGAVANAQGDYPSARAFSEESLAINREIRNPWGIVASLGNLGLIAHKHGDHPAARVLYGESLAIRRELGDRLGIATVLEGLATIDHAEGRFARAATLLGAADAVRTLLGAPLTPSDHLELAATTGGLEAALGEAAFAVAWAAGQSMPLDEAVALALQPEPETTYAPSPLQ